MKRALFVLSFFVISAAPAAAQQAGELGVGAILGNPLGPTVKYWLDSRQAFQLGFGYSGDLAGWADWLWHDERLIPRQPKEGRVLPYFGPGLRFEGKSDFEFGFRLVAGAAWRPARTPLEFFAEIAPVVRAAPGASVGLDGGVGLRYCFTP